ncbi:E3 ubiquitin-protein ligase CSU1-like [Hibiscus syriacus]|nr:E3 ubiquitin-protein ligase CSU1-like [Hibiscus syriacus]
MPPVDNSLAGLTLDDVLGKAKQAQPPAAQNKAKLSQPPVAQNKAKLSQPPVAQNKAKQAQLPASQNKTKQSEPPPAQNLVLADTVPDDTSTKDKKSWKLIREKLRLKKAVGSSWTSSIPIPASDINVQRSQKRAPDGKSRPLLARRTSVRFDNNDSDSSTPSNGPPSRSFKSYDDEEGIDSFRGAPLGKERSLSAREAVASQEATEAAAAAAAEKEEAENNGTAEGEETVKMSLMDLLGESGSSYINEDEEYCEEEEEEEEEKEETVQSKGMEFTCCVCKVNITSSAYMPCTHTFCRLCSKEFSVQRGSCPLCNAFVLEILEIF